MRNNTKKHFYEKLSTIGKIANKLKITKGYCYKYTNNYGAILNLFNPLSYIIIVGLFIVSPVMAMCVDYNIKQLYGHIVELWEVPNDIIWIDEMPDE